MITSLACCAFIDVSQRRVEDASDEKEIDHRVQSGGRQRSSDFSQEHFSVQTATQIHHVPLGTVLNDSMNTVHHSTVPGMVLEVPASISGCPISPISHDFVSFYSSDHLLSMDETIDLDPQASNKAERTLISEYSLQPSSSKCGEATLVAGSPHSGSSSPFSNDTSCFFEDDNRQHQKRMYTDSRQFYMEMRPTSPIPFNVAHMPMTDAASTSEVSNTRSSYDRSSNVYELSPPSIYSSKSERDDFCGSRAAEKRKRRGRRRGRRTTNVP